VFPSDFPSLSHTQSILHKIGAERVAFSHSTKHHTPHRCVVWDSFSLFASACQAVQAGGHQICCSLLVDNALMNHFRLDAVSRERSGCCLGRDPHIPRQPLRVQCQLAGAPPGAGGRGQSWSSHHTDITRNSHPAAIYVPWLCCIEIHANPGEPFRHPHSHTLRCWPKLLIYCLVTKYMDFYCRILLY